MDIKDPNPVRVVGDYILGPRIGSGSFAVVWRATHSRSGTEVAVKEIDKKRLSAKVRDNLLKEISILSTIDHPNITRLFESIETDDKIYLVLELCCGGDLAEYINRHGKVSESVARHFMRQLARGLQVLQEKHLIHRDLKPQNLLLSSDEVMPLLKIGDFGFARSLTSQDDFATTQCGSPLYMAPEIIRHQKYDAKADLWSVGAILFQLVIGKPPFGGNNHFQLFQNILECTELKFPKGALEELNEDCLDLCRSLLRLSAVERLTFKEFFSHSFLQEPRQVMAVEQAPLPSQQDLMIEKLSPPGQLTLNLERAGFPTFNTMPLVYSGHFLDSTSRRHKIIISSEQNTIGDKTIDNFDGRCLSNQLGVADSMELIEKEYVLVNPHFASLEETPLPDAKHSYYPLKKKEHMALAFAIKTNNEASSQLFASGPLASFSGSCRLEEEQKLTGKDPETRLLLMHQYVQALAELAQEKLHAGKVLEYYSVEFVVLALYMKAQELCDAWMTSTEDLNKRSIIHKKNPIVAPYSKENIDFSAPLTVKGWFTKGFLIAIDRANKFSYHLENTNAATVIPDTMNILYQKALALGRSAAVDEYMSNKCSAFASYSKSILLLSFIVGEASALLLKPPVLITPEDEKRIQSYILTLQSRQAYL